MVLVWDHLCWGAQETTACLLLHPGARACAPPKKNIPRKQQEPPGEVTELACGTDQVSCPSSPLQSCQLCHLSPELPSVFSGTVMWPVLSPSCAPSLSAPSSSHVPPASSTSSYLGPTCPTIFSSASCSLCLHHLWVPLFSRPPPSSAPSPSAISSLTFTPGPCHHRVHHSVPIRCSSGSAFPSPSTLPALLLLPSPHHSVWIAPIITNPPTICASLLCPHSPTSLVQSTVPSVFFTMHSM